jgi:putative oxidoreductase
MERERGRHSLWHRDRAYRDADTVETRADGTVVEEPVVEPWRLGWNSGADMGLLFIRVALGAIFAVHGAQKIFGWFNGPGLDGFAEQLRQNGFEQVDVVSAMAGFVELVGGVLMILGLFTPLAGAALLAVAINAVWVKWNGQVFTHDDALELEIMLGAAAAGLTLTGPGRVALDNGRVWFRHPVATGWFFVLLGIAAAIVGRILLHGLY